MRNYAAEALGNQNLSSNPQVMVALTKAINDEDS